MQDIYQVLTETIKSNRRSALCIITRTSGSTPRKAGSKMIVYNDGTISGTIGGGSIELKVISDALEAMHKGEPVVISYKLEEDLGMHCGGSADVYIEPLAIVPDLYIFGAGHIGRALAHLSSLLGFRVSLFDERKDIWNEFDASAYSCVTGNYTEMAGNAVYHDNTYVVIVTPKHLYDEDILAICAKKQTAYLGMIGSRNKVAAARKKFLAEKTLTEEQLNRVDMPIGLPFAAETPEEIAVSILARMIDVRNKKKES